VVPLAVELPEVVVNVEIEDMEGVSKIVVCPLVMLVMLVVVPVDVVVVLVAVRLSVVAVAVTILTSGVATATEDSSSSRPSVWKLACKDAVKSEESLAACCTASKI
jgi:hypothetical protein